MSRPLKVDKHGKLALSHAQLCELIRDWLTAEGWLVIDLQQNGRFVPEREVKLISIGKLDYHKCQRLQIGEPGRPDMLAIKYFIGSMDKAAFFIEPKVGRDRQSPEQKAYMVNMEERGFETCVPRSLEYLHSWMAERGWR